jgi:hypothetical protein
MAEVGLAARAGARIETFSDLEAGFSHVVGTWGLEHPTVTSLRLCFGKLNQKLLAKETASTILVRLKGRKSKNIQQAGFPDGHPL